MRKSTIKKLRLNICIKISAASKSRSLISSHVLSPVIVRLPISKEDAKHEIRVPQGPYFI